MENIEANNKSVSCVLDTKTGNLQFAVLMKGFEFKKALMQEHFNENYVESDKYPKGEFRGHIENNSAIDYSKEGSYTAKVKGKLTLHGETKDIETDGKIEVKGGKLYLNSEFTALVSDYKISIPSLVKDKIQNTIRVTVDCMLDPLK